MEQKYQEKKRSGFGRYMRSALVAGGSVTTAGITSLISFPISTAYDLIYNQIPNMADGKIVERFGDSLIYGSQIAGGAAVVGGIAGIFLTAYSLDKIQSLLERKKR